MLQPSKNTKEIPIPVTITLQLKKLNKTCLPEAYATQTIGVIYLKSGTVMIDGITAQAYLKDFQRL